MSDTQKAPYDRTDEWESRQDAKRQQSAPAMSEDEMSKLRQCPCGKNATFRLLGNYPSELGYVKCASCGMEGSLYETRIEAVTAWNHRPVEDALKANNDSLSDQLLELNTKFLTKEACIDALVEALEKIIEMNRRHAEDEYGDANKAESWRCVIVARAARKLAKEER